MFKMKTLLVAGLMLAAPMAAPAQTAPALSDGGKAAFQQVMTARQATLAPLVQRKAELQQQFEALVDPDAYDHDKLAAVMAEMRSVEGQIVETMGTSLLSLLEKLPEADRNLFLASMKKGPDPQVSRVETGPGR